jgi:surface antigen
MKKIALTCLTVAALALGGCQTTQGWGTKQTVGTGVGAVAGGLAGSQFGKGHGQLWATGIGALLGGLVGSEVGASLDNADRMAMANAQYTANNAPIGEQIAWNNPQSGNSGYIVPVRDGTSSSGRYCREYQQTIIVGGQKQSGYGTACRQPDGSWEVVN